MRAAYALAFLIVLAGCLEPEGGSDGPASCSGTAPRWVPPSGAESDGRLRSDLIGFFPNASAVAATARLPAGWKLDVETLAADAANGSLVRFGLSPAGAAAAGATVAINWTATGANDCSAGSGERSWSVASAATTKYVQPGDGVSVYYAGFWLNGTLFSTNMASIDKSDWPRGGWYASGDNRPLNVYVYDRDRSERAAYWAPTDPTTNQPAKWSYVPTIAGFNNGLKGLSTGATRVAVLAPDQAYTQPGREAHPLYGDSLVFFIDVVEIVDVPCPPEAPNRAACRLPA